MQHLLRHHTLKRLGWVCCALWFAGYLFVLGFREARHDTLRHDLARAVWTGDVQTTKRLLDQGAPVEVAIWSVSGGITEQHRQILRLLLMSPADTQSNYDAFMLAYRHSVLFKWYPEVELFKKRGIDVHTKTKGLSGYTPLQVILEREWREKEPDVKWRVTESQVLDAIEYLLEHGADVNARGGDGKTALRIATTYPENKVMTSLKRHGAKY